MTIQTKGKDDFVTREFDEFTDHLVVKSKYNVNFGEKYWGRSGEISYTMIKESENEILALNLFFQDVDNDWLHIKNVIFNCDQVNHNIEFNKHDSTNFHVEDSRHYVESGSLLFSEDVFKKICDANVIKIRIQGKSDRYEMTPDDIKLFQLMSQQFYNNVYNSSLYQNSLIVPPEPVKESNPYHHEIKVNSVGTQLKYLAIIIAIFGSIIYYVFFVLL